ncbi:MAG TPA: rhodanese-like domain-containing protein [Gammaproteobacteria bacterium]|nr:rhodanese-like domain-containing protein [Gammaproteobacteria bacterium]
MTFLNIAAYKFVSLDNLASLQQDLKAAAQNLFGTILISPEGINIMLAGEHAPIRAFQAYLQQNPLFSDLHYKESASDTKPFRRFWVKIKKEIIAFGIPVDPVNQKAPYIKPSELKTRLDNHEEIYILDTRNDYEIIEGAFENTHQLNIQHFRDFPKAAESLDPALKNKTIVTVCTGGIRCEKAAILLQQYGFEKVYQLENGILEYMKECGTAHYEGKCFVFDERVAI